MTVVIGAICCRPGLSTKHFESQPTIIPLNWNLTLNILYNSSLSKKNNQIEKKNHWTTLNLCQLEFLVQIPLNRKSWRAYLFHIPSASQSVSYQLLFIVHSTVSWMIDVFLLLLLLLRRYPGSIVYVYEANIECIHQWIEQKFGE